MLAILEWGGVDNIINMHPAAAASRPLPIPVRKSSALRLPVLTVLLALSYDAPGHVLMAAVGKCKASSHATSPAVVDDANGGSPRPRLRGRRCTGSTSSGENLAPWRSYNQVLRQVPEDVAAQAAGMFPRA